MKYQQPEVKRKLKAVWLSWALECRPVQSYAKFEYMTAGLIPLKSKFAEEREGCRLFKSRDHVSDHQCPELYSRTFSLHFPPS